MYLRAIYICSYIAIHIDIIVQIYIISACGLAIASHACMANNVNPACQCDRKTMQHSYSYIAIEYKLCLMLSMRKELFYIPTK